MGLEGGVDLALRRLKVDERHNIVKYKKQLAELSDEPSLEILREVVADEHEHYPELSSLIRARPPLPATGRAGACELDGCSTKETS